jgi:hypothetical protein
MKNIPILAICTALSLLACGKKADSPEAIEEKIEEKIEEMLDSRIGVNEESAIGSLKSIATGQEQFRSQNCVDQDSNGVGEYGLLGELSGLKEYRGYGGNCKDSPFIPSILGKTDDKGRVKKSGYYFILYLFGDGKIISDASPDVVKKASMQEEEYVVYAFPAEPGQSGIRVFALNSMGQIFQLKNAGNTWGGDNIPPAGLAYKTGKAPTKGASDFVEPGEKGGAEEGWEPCG